MEKNIKKEKETEEISTTSSSSENVLTTLMMNSEKPNSEPSYIKEIRIAVIGNVDSGKSTLVGCLTKNIKDDGRGYARKFVFNYQHETESGRTSSIAEEILGFKNHVPIDIGRISEKKNISWKEIAEKSDSVITLLDLCGHEKYLKTTMYGLTALLPDYAIILIGTNMGVQRMTKEHLGIAISLNVPFFIVFTKIDIAPKDIKDKTINTFTNLLKTGLQKTIYNVKSVDDAKACSQAIIGGVVVPIFQISTVTGEGLDYLKNFLANLTPRHSLNSDNHIIKTPQDPTEMLLDSAFNTKVGVIYAGVLSSGKLYVGQKVLMGPTIDGVFKPVQIKSIQFLRCDVNEICCGNSCSVKLRSLDKAFDLNTQNFKKGMVLVDENHLPPTLEFEIEAVIVHHSSTIKIGYQSVIHSHVVRQTATITGMNKEFMRAGDTGIIKFKFLKKPEYLHLGDVVLFREGRTRGKGKIINILPFDLNKYNEEKKNSSMKKKGKIIVKGKNNISTKDNLNNKDFIGKDLKKKGKK